MKLTPSSMARLSTALAWSRSAGSPQIPGPVRRMAPNPSRLTVRSPPMSIVPASAAEGVVTGPSWRQNLRKPLEQAFFEDGSRLGQEGAVVGQDDELADAGDLADDGRRLHGQDLVSVAMEQQQRARRQGTGDLTTG